MWLLTVAVARARYTSLLLLLPLSLLFLLLLLLLLLLLFVVVVLVFVLLLLLSRCCTSFSSPWCNRPGWLGVTYSSSLGKKGLAYGNETKSKNKQAKAACVFYSSRLDGAKKMAPDDLSCLPYLDEGTIVEALRSRHAKGDAYVSNLQSPLSSLSFQSSLSSLSVLVSLSSLSF